MDRTTAPTEGESSVRRWLGLVKRVATTLAALAAVGKALGWL